MRSLLRFAGKALLTAVLVLVSLEGLAQVATRIVQGRWFAEKALEASPPIYMSDPDLRWRLRPNLSVPHRTQDFSVTVRTNSEGYRDANGGALLGGCDVLFAGNSFTFGWGVEEHDRFSSLIAAELRKARKGLRIMNIGVPGYGLPQERLLLERAFVLGLRPRLVVLEIWPFDWDIMDAERMGCFDGRLLSKEALTLPEWYLRAKIFALNHICLAEMAHKLTLACAYMRRSRAMRSGTVTRDLLYGGFGLDAYLKGPYPPPEEEASKKALEALTRIAELTRRHALHLAVVVIPSSFQMGGSLEQWRNLYGVLGEMDMDRPHRMIREHMASLGVPCIDLLEPIRRAAGGPAPLYFSRDLHWTREGHGVAAKEILAELRKRRLFHDE
jgi:hypothetical protein